MPIRIKVRQFGGYAIDLTTGDVELVDHMDNPIPFNRDKPVLALCRCAMSLKRPFCDGAHRDCGLDLSIVGAAPPPPATPSTPV